MLGSGAAGLAAALAVRPVRSVLIVTKDVLNAGSTAWAQGGLAGVLDPTDSLEEHVRDTLAAGAGLCDEAVVRELVAEAPTSIRYLMRLGAAFDPGADGAGPALTREGGHSHNRIVHAGGDRSGAEVQRTLDESAVAAGVDVLERAFALDLVTGTGRRAAGRRPASRSPRSTPDGGVESVGVVTARAVVLATGGYGQVFASTSNPPAVTGDGSAIALRAGLAVRDVEFVQFHPTVMWRGPDATGQQPLVSEAVRGEGAILYDAAGERVMAGVHPLEDLAPRDVVAAAISRRMAEAPAGVDDHVFLDATNMGERFYERFPSITAACREIGIDPARRPHPGRAGRPLRVRRRAGAPRRDDGAAGPVRRRRGGVHRRARRQPAGVEQPDRGRRRRDPPRSRPGVGAARAGRRCAAGRARPACSTAASGPTSARRCRATSAWSATTRRWRLRPTCWRRSPARSTAPAQPLRDGVGGDERADRRVGRRRRGHGADGEPRLPPAHRLPRLPRRVAPPPRRRASTPTVPSRCG